MRLRGRLECREARRRGFAAPELTGRLHVSRCLEGCAWGVCAMRPRSRENGYVPQGTRIRRGRAGVGGDVGSVTSDASGSARLCGDRLRRRRGGPQGQPSAHDVRVSAHLVQGPCLWISGRLCAGRDRANVQLYRATLRARPLWLSRRRTDVWGSLRDPLRAFARRRRIRAARGDTRRSGLWRARREDSRRGRSDRQKRVAGSERSADAGARRQRHGAARHERREAATGRDRAALCATRRDHR